jgi:hypothetical protein
VSLASVKAALTTKAVNTLGTIPVAGENLPFSEPAESKFARIHFSPGPTSVATLGSSGLNKIDGYLQVDLCYPIGSGDKVASDDFETFYTAFKAGLKLTSSNQVVTIVSCSCSPGIRDGKNFSIYITIRWWAFIPR